MSSEMEPCPAVLCTKRPLPPAAKMQPPKQRRPKWRPARLLLPPQKRSEEEYKSLIHRLNRIEGQIRGIRGMVEKDVYCADILVQVAAANSALNAFSRELLSQHVRTCVADDLRAGSDEKLDELLKLLPKLMK